MSVDFTATLMVGVPWERVVTENTVTTKVTKYDESTGKPYEKEVNETVVRVLGMDETGSDPTEYIEEVLKLEIRCAGYDSDEDDSIVGIVLEEAEQDEPQKVTPLSKISAALDGLSKILQEQGYKGPNPKVYLLLSAN